MPRFFWRIWSFILIVRKLPTQMCSEHWAVTGLGLKSFGQLATHNIHLLGLTSNPCNHHLSRFIASLLWVNVAFLGKGSTKKNWYFLGKRKIKYGGHGGLKIFAAFVFVSLFVAVFVSVVSLYLYFISYQCVCNASPWCSPLQAARAISDHPYIQST